jgi:hypothetical protein
MGVSCIRPLPSNAQNMQPTSRLASLAGIAAEAEGLQVAEVVGTALVPGHDGVHLQGPLVRDLPSNSLAPQHSQRPLARVSTRYFTEPLIGVRWRLLCANTSSPPCMRKASRRWWQNCSSWSRSASLSSTASLREGFAYAEAFGYAAHQGDGALLAAGDAVAGEHIAHHAHAFGDVLPQALMGGGGGRGHGGISCRSARPCRACRRYG